MLFQLYTIYGTCMNYTFPLIYCLATRKNENFYRRLMNQLVLHATELNMLLSPQFIISDFELAFMNAANEMFPNSTINGCLFHLTQAIWKHTVSKGLKQPYSDNEVVRNTVRKLLALPFVPVEDICEVFDEIVNSIPEDHEHEEQLMEVINYVEHTYVRGRPARGRRAATNPQFPPNIWSVYSLTMNRRQRSTNAVEGFHSKFQRMIISYHSGIWKFLDHIKMDQKENEICILQLEAGHSRVRYPVKPSYKKNLEMIERIVENYQHFKDGNNISQYLKNISYRIKLYRENEVVEETEEQTEE